MENAAIGQMAPTTVSSSVRTREYLTTREIERLMAAARKSSRYGHRDATMILIGYRHGLRASELCDLQWSQVELTAGRLHVRRAKSGSPSVHPMQGDEIRALRRLQREQGPSSHVFMTERGGPMTPKAFHALFGRIGGRAKMPFAGHPQPLGPRNQPLCHCFGARIRCSVGSACCTMTKARAGVANPLHRSHRNDACPRRYPRRWG